MPTARRILKRHKLEKIVKIPEEIFSGVTASIFVFRAGVPQNDAEIFACYIEKDGLETVKNQGRQDIKNRWQEIEDRWVNIIYKQSGNETIQWLKPDEHLSYQMPEAPFEITEADFKRTVLSYALFEKGINEQEFKEQVLNTVLYNIEVDEKYKMFIDLDKSTNKNIDIAKWKEFPLEDLFDIRKGKRLTKADMKVGNIKYIGATAFNNGITAKIGNDENLHPANTITVCYNGSVGEAFYQTETFWATDDVNVLYPKFNLTQCTALFLTTLIHKIGKRFGYTNKWTKEIMGKTQILLPATPFGAPDWQFMDSYIKSLSYSRCL